ncbi:MAG: helix-turn-helix domain-containing protein [Candidatus Krumholzibacteria bacterium]|nr:helix-turn-helix domain-containing protein [Candidatus Krumholzibacteria bacterium]
MTNPDLGPQYGPVHDKAIKVLRGLGLTEAEAETYFTALRTCKNEPLSSYKLAQAMGRDPANVAKTLASLVRLQAMTVVQDKPRLFLPSDPADFTERVLRRLQRNGREAVELLQSFQTPEPDGVTLSLSSGTQIMAKARELLAGCQQHVTIFGSRESLRELGAELEELGENPERTVRVLSPVPMISDNVQITVFSPLSDLPPLALQEFLQVVVDDRAWLSAVLADETGSAPSGWWGNHSPIAPVMGGTLTLAWQAGHSARPAAEPVADPIPEPSPDPIPEPESESQPTPPELEKPVAEEMNENEMEFEEGITFLMRHEDRKAKEKGEP